MVVLALDPSGSTGFSVGSAGGKPTLGVIRLDSKMSPARRFCLLEDRVRNIIATREVDWVAVESRFSQPQKPKSEGNRFNSQTERMGYGYEAAILMACEREGIGTNRIIFAAASQWRKTAFGKGSAPKELKRWEERRDYLKGEAILLVAQRGWGLVNDDAAESALLWSYACEQVQPRSTENLLPLFELAALP
jgi:Holliday junction resolvasome RuvABC endonuclease subunit